MKQCVKRGFLFHLGISPPSSQKQSVEQTEHQLLVLDREKPEATEAVRRLDIRKRPKTQGVSAKTIRHRAEATRATNWYKHEDGH